MAALERLRRQTGDGVTVRLNDTVTQTLDTDTLSGGAICYINRPGGQRPSEKKNEKLRRGGLSFGVSDTMPPASAYVRHLRLMTAYNTWAWERLFASVRAMPADQWTRPVGVFCGSLRGTVHHVLFADWLWSSRLGHPVAGIDLHQLVPLWAASDPGTAWTRAGDGLLPGVPALHTLAATQLAVAQQCERWEGVAAALTDAHADGMMSYTSTDQRVMTKHRGAALSHVFNHATHHRGQASAAVTLLGFPAPEMDLTYFLDEHPHAASSSL